MHGKGSYVRSNMTRLEGVWEHGKLIEEFHWF